MSKTKKMYLALFVLTLAIVMLLGSFTVFADRPPPSIIQQANYNELSVFLGNNALWFASFDLRGWSTPQMRAQVSVERNYRVSVYGLESVVFARRDRSSIPTIGLVRHMDERGANNPFPANQNRSVHFTEAVMRSRINAPSTHRVYRMESSRTIGGAVFSDGRSDRGGWNPPNINHPNF